MSSETRKWNYSTVFWLNKPNNILNKCNIQFNSITITLSGLLSTMWQFNLKWYVFGVVDHLVVVEFVCIFNIFVQISRILHWHRINVSDAWREHLKLAIRINFSIYFSWHFIIESDLLRFFTFNCNRYERKKNNV